jgi:zinc/manganese transport system permease protein
MHVLLEPGFFSNAPVRTALLLGAVVAAVSAVVGVITVVRSQSFAGHALTDVATAGGSGAYYLGVGALWGFLGGSLAGAGAMELIGVQRVRRRDLATGIVLGAATGISALFLYLDTTVKATTGATQQILFGSIFSVSNSTVPYVAAFSGLVIMLMTIMRRPLLLTSLSSEIASSQGVRVRLVGVLFMLCLAVSVGLSSIAIGSILSTALLIGPAATALRVARSIAAATLLAIGLGIISAWIGILLAYDSFYWDPSSQGLPVSFFIVAICFVFYLFSSLVLARRRSHATRRPVVTDFAFSAEGH